jgi:hypothetical protein
VTDTVEALIVDLLLWLDMHERTYDETMSAWRTSCPKLPVWEDANDRGLIVMEQAIVRVSEKGLALLSNIRSR